MATGEQSFDIHSLNTLWFASTFKLAVLIQYQVLFTSNRTSFAVCIAYKNFRFVGFVSNRWFCPQFVKCSLHILETRVFVLTCRTYCLARLSSSFLTEWLQLTRPVAKQLKKMEKEWRCGFHMNWCNSRKMSESVFPIEIDWFCLYSWSQFRKLIIHDKMPMNHLDWK